MNGDFFLFKIVSSYVFLVPGDFFFFFRFGVIKLAPTRGHTTYSPAPVSLTVENRA